MSNFFKSCCNAENQIVKAEGLSGDKGGTRGSSWSSKPTAHRNKPFKMEVVPIQKEETSLIKKEEKKKKDIKELQSLATRPNINQATPHPFQFEEALQSIGIPLKKHSHSQRCSRELPSLEDFDISICEQSSWSSNSLVLENSEFHKNPYHFEAFVEPQEKGRPGFLSEKMVKIGKNGVQIEVKNDVLINRIKVPEIELRDQEEEDNLEGKIAFHSEQFHH